MPNKLPNEITVSNFWGSLQGVCSFFNPINQWDHFRGDDMPLRGGTKVCILDGVDRYGDGGNNVCNGYAFHSRDHGGDACDGHIRIHGDDARDGTCILAFSFYNIYSICDVYDRFSGNEVCNTHTLICGTPPIFYFLGIRFRGIPFLKIHLLLSNSRLDYEKEGPLDSANAPVTYFLGAVKPPLKKQSGHAKVKKTCIGFL
jgi:hypothetical protein